MLTVRAFVLSGGGTLHSAAEQEKKQDRDNDEVQEPASGGDVD